MCTRGKEGGYILASFMHMSFIDEPWVLWSCGVFVDAISRIVYKEEVEKSGSKVSWRLEKLCISYYCV